MVEMLSHREVIQLCAKTLRFYDSRLVEHGERVAYIACRMLAAMDEKTSAFDVKTLMLLSLFHDVGAYKTDEIDRMVEFETVDVQAHSVYGYLFLKHFTPVGDAAEAILYHHTPPAVLSQIHTPMRGYAELLHIADRADIALESGMSGKALLSSLRLNCFDETLLNALSLVLAQPAFRHGLLGGSASEWAMRTISKMNVSEAEAVKYLKMIVYSIDFKSENTVVHSISTTIVSLYMAWRVGLSSSEMEKIYYAALIHDVGKLAIPEAILEFPGRLSAEQMKIMRRHVRYTEVIASGILPPDVTAIAIHHHERLDGSGYPYGLTAAELSQSDRIVAIADIISALLGRRSYKESYDWPKILDILKGMSADGKLDRTLVELVEKNHIHLQEIIDERTAPIHKLYARIHREYNERMEERHS